MKKDEFNLTYFKCIRDEITKRVQLHYTLVTTKVVLSGAMFAFLWTQESTRPQYLSPFLMTAIFCFLFDFIVLENLGWIRSAGNYLKQNVEREELGLICWETHFAQAGLEKKGSYVNWPWRCFSPCSYVLGVWAIGFLLWVGHIFFQLDLTDKADVVTFLLASYLMPYTFWLVLRNLAGEVPMPSKPPTTELVWTHPDGKTGPLSLIPTKGNGKRRRTPGRRTLQPHE